MGCSIDVVQGVIHPCSGGVVQGQMNQGTAVESRVEQGR